MTTLLPARDVAINMAIPNTMNRESLRLLAQLARTLPEDAVVVEAGSLFGATAWVLSKNAPASARIYCIDPWEHAPWIDTVRARFPGAPPLSPEAFRHFTADCPNVVPVQGYAPGALVLDEPIDLFFEDATHSDPVFSANMAHFVPRLKPGGILCGDDYVPRWPAVVAGVRAQAAAWGTPGLVRNQLWAMQKPLVGGGGTIIDRLGATWGDDVVVRCWRRDGSLAIAAHDCWSTMVGDRVPVTAVSVELPGFPGLDLETTFLGPDGAVVAQARSGQLALLGEHRVHGLRVAVRGSAAATYGVAYQARFIDAAQKQDVWTALRRNDALLSPALTDARLGGLRITLEQRAAA